MPVAVDKRSSCSCTISPLEDSIRSIIHTERSACSKHTEVGGLAASAAATLARQHDNRTANTTKHFPRPACIVWSINHTQSSATSRARRNSNNPIRNTHICPPLADGERPPGNSGATIDNARAAGRYPIEETTIRRNTCINPRR